MRVRSISDSAFQLCLRPWNEGERPVQFLVSTSERPQIEFTVAKLKQHVEASASAHSCVKVKVVKVNQTQRIPFEMNSVRQKQQLHVLSTARRCTKHGLRTIQISVIPAIAREWGGRSRMPTAAAAGLSCREGAVCNITGKHRSRDGRVAAVAFLPLHSSFTGAALRAARCLAKQKERMI